MNGEIKVQQGRARRARKAARASRTSTCQDRGRQSRRPAELTTDAAAFWGALRKAPRRTDRLRSPTRTRFACPQAGRCLRSSSEERRAPSDQFLGRFLQHLVNTLILGGTYALLGIGLTLIFGIMRVVNFTHGELYAFGAYVVFALTMLLGSNFFLALLAGDPRRAGARGRDRARTAAAHARRRHRYDHAGHDRRLDRHAEH